MSDPIGVGLIGIGGYAANHVRVLEYLETLVAAALRAVVVRRPERHPEAVARLQGRGIRIFGDTLAMLQEMRGRVQLVSVVTGIDSHAELASAAMTAGYAVLLDKPPAATVQEIDAMVCAQEKSGRPCAVLFQWLSFPPYRALKELVVSGHLGRARRARCMVGEPRAAEYYARNEWAGRWKVDGRLVLDGPLKNALLHDLNTLLYLCSPRVDAAVSPVAATCEMYRAHAIEGEDTTCLRLDCEDDLTLHFYGTHACTERWRALEIEYEHGTVVEQRSGEAVRLSIRRRDGAVDHLGDVASRGGLLVSAYENVLAHLTRGDRLHSPLAMSRSVTLANNGAHLSARAAVEVPSDLVQRTRILRQHVTGDGRPQESWVSIRGIREWMTEAYRRGALFSELELPWASARPAVSVDALRELRL